MTNLHPDQNYEDGPLLFRPLRILIEDGNPPGWIKAVTPKNAFRKDSLNPVGLFSKTDRQRLIFWPVLPQTPVEIRGSKSACLIDHVTLEFPSWRMHTTFFTEDGHRKHHSDSWKLQEFADTGLALWFQMFVRWELIEENGPLKAERSVKMPDSDKERRQAEFGKYVESIAWENAKVPERNSAGDFLLLVFYVVIDPTIAHKVTSEMFLAGSNVDELVDGWPVGNSFLIQPVRFSVGDVQIVMASACPPGRLKDNLIFGFPRAK